MNLTQYTQ